MSPSSFTWPVAELLRGDYNPEPFLLRKANLVLQASI